MFFIRQARYRWEIRRLVYIYFYIIDHNFFLYMKLILVFRITQRW